MEGKWNASGSERGMSRGVTGSVGGSNEGEVKVMIGRMRMQLYKDHEGMCV